MVLADSSFRIGVVPLEGVFVADLESLGMEQVVEDGIVAFSCILFELDAIGAEAGSAHEVGH